MKQFLLLIIFASIFNFCYAKCNFPKTEISPESNFSTLKINPDKENCRLFIQDTNDENESYSIIHKSIPGKNPNGIYTNWIQNQEYNEILNKQGL